MSIRIISSRKFRFYSPDRQENIVVEGKNIISTIPDWAVKDGTFQAARAAGLIQILSSKEELKQAENNPENIVPQNAHEAKKMEKDNASDEAKEGDVGSEVDNTSEDDQDDNASDEAKEGDRAARKAARAARKAKKAE